MFIYLYRYLHVDIANWVSRWGSICVNQFIHMHTYCINIRTDIHILFVFVSGLPVPRHRAITRTAIQKQCIRLMSPAKVCATGLWHQRAANHHPSNTQQQQSKAVMKLLCVSTNTLQIPAFAHFPNFVTLSHYYKRNYAHHTNIMPFKFFKNYQ